MKCATSGLMRRYVRHTNTETYHCDAKNVAIHFAAERWKTPVFLSVRAGLSDEVTLLLCLAIFGSLFQTRSA